MRFRNSLMAMLCSIACSILPFNVCADYSTHPDALLLMDDLVKNYQFDKEDLISVLSEAEKKEAILAAISKPAEKTLEWFEYKRIFITSDRIEKGKEFIQSFQEPLARAEKEYGVPKEIITAIIGVETRYGRNKGSHRVIDALTTLAFDYPPRSPFFTKELKEAFILAREQKFDITMLKGSYAGAMGYGQFIPSSYRNFAVDFDADNVADILENPVDAIGSVANYFVGHGWRKDEKVAVRLVDVKKIESVKQFTSEKLEPLYLISDIRKSGISISDSIASDQIAKIQNYMLESEEENWLTMHNFYVITRYNHSHLYAMAVYQLALELGLSQ